MKEYMKEDALSTILGIILGLILGFGFLGIIFWGIGLFVVWAFGINFVWTFWHGVAVAIVVTLLRNLFSFTVKKEK